VSSRSSLRWSSDREGAEPSSSGTNDRMAPGSGPSARAQPRRPVRYRRNRHLRA
jgi:hypothetical protein